MNRTTTLVERTQLSLDITNGLRQLESPYGLAVAAGVVVRLAKDVQLTKEKFLKAMSDSWDGAL